METDGIIQEELRQGHAAGSPGHRVAGQLDGEQQQRQQDREGEHREEGPLAPRLGDDRRDQGAPGGQAVAAGGQSASEQARATPPCRFIMATKSGVTSSLERRRPG